jgi:hypothetical protein
MDATLQEESRLSGLAGWEHWSSSKLFSGVRSEGFVEGRLHFLPKENEASSLYFKKPEVFVSFASSC